MAVADRRGFLSLLAGAGIGAALPRWVVFEPAMLRAEHVTNPATLQAMTESFLRHLEPSLIYGSRFRGGPPFMTPESPRWLSVGCVFSPETEYNIERRLQQAAGSMATEIQVEGITRFDRFGHMMTGCECAEARSELCAVRGVAQWDPVIDRISYRFEVRGGHA